MGLVVARAERMLVSNLATGLQFLEKESNSHYNLHIMCLRAADASFKGIDLVIPETMSQGTAKQLAKGLSCSDSGRLTFFEEMARSQERLELRATNAHQTISQWLLFAKNRANINHPKLTSSSTCCFSISFN